MVESDFGLCSACWAETMFLGGAVCDSCGRPVTAEATECRVVCDGCLSDPPPWARGRSAILYRGAGRNLILAFKHGDRTDIALPAAQWLHQVVRPLLKGVDVIAPVPLHRLRFLKRRYNQASLLAKKLASLSRTPFCADLLVRPRGLGGLEGLGAVEREEKLRGAIEPNRRRAHLVRGAKVLLVDDVLTSGATLRAATQACLTANAKEVCVATLARVAKDA